MTDRALIAALGAGALVAAVTAAGLASARLSRAEVAALAEATTRNHFPAVDPLMLAAIAEIESNRNPLAIRLEPRLGDASVGMMQTLVGTAKWLFDDMGATAKGEPTFERLFDAEVSVYCAAAYLNWLSRWRLQARDERFMVMSYNGGPNADSPQTRRYYDRFRAARDLLTKGN